MQDVITQKIAIKLRLANYIISLIDTPPKYTNEYGNYPIDSQKIDDIEYKTKQIIKELNNIHKNK